MREVTENGTTVLEKVLGRVRPNSASISAVMFTFVIFPKQLKLELDHPILGDPIAAQVYHAREGKREKL